MKPILPYFDQGFSMFTEKPNFFQYVFHEVVHNINFKCGIVIADHYS